LNVNNGENEGRGLFQKENEMRLVSARRRPKEMNEVVDKLHQTTGVVPVMRGKEGARSQERFDRAEEERCAAMTK